MRKNKILILSRNQHHHFEHLYREPSFEIIETEVWEPEIVEKHQPNILITPSCDWHESYNCIMKAKELSIPTLYCPDGIIEWKHTWENPRYGKGNRIPYQQPVVADKISCIGLHSFMLLENFGNTGRCELVGVPRFNVYLERYKKVKPSLVKNNIILIATANTIGFSADQINTVENALRDVRDFFELNTHLKPIWRVSKLLKDKLSLVDEFPHYSGRKLIDVLHECDAVITTQSTLILEAWLNRLPLASLNYGNFPEYINTAWRITHSQQIREVVDELLNPPESKLHFQDTQLHFNLYVADAVQNQIELIKKMIQWKEKHEHTMFTTQLLPLHIACHTVPFDRRSLYPDHKLFKIEETDLYQRIGFLEEENNGLKSKLQSRGFFYWIDRFLQALYRKWK